MRQSQRILPTDRGEVRERWREWRRRAARSLTIGNYRRYIAGHSVSVVGTWIQRVAQDWLVLDLTGSAVAVGVANALQFLPILLAGAWAGLLVDRVDRRTLLLLTQTASAVLALALAATVWAGAARVEVVMAFALALGFVTLVDHPARHAFVADLVPPADYVNAQALNSTVHNVGRLVGPALAGGLIVTVGTAGAFAVNGLSFLAVLLSLAVIRRATLEKRAVARPGGPWQGLALVARDPTLRACVVLVAVVALFGQNLRVILPVFASDVLGGDALTYGWLTSAVGAGALVGGVLAAGREAARPRALRRSAMAFGAVGLAAAVPTALAPAALLMAALGLSLITFNTLARAVLLTGVERGLHGRVMALYAQIFLGSIPIGAPVVGVVVELLGAQGAMAAIGGVTLMAAILVHRRLDT